MPCEFKSRCPHQNVDVVQWLELQPSKLIMRVRFPSSTPYRQMFQGGELVSKTDCGGFDSLLSMPKNAACLGGEEVVLKTIDRLFGLQVRILCAAPKMLP